MGEIRNLVFYFILLYDGDNQSDIVIPICKNKANHIGIDVAFECNKWKNPRRNKCNKKNLYGQKHEASN